MTLPIDEKFLEKMITCAEINLEILNNFLADLKGGDPFKRLTAFGVFANLADSVNIIQKSLKLGMFTAQACMDGRLELDEKYKEWTIANADCHPLYDKRDSGNALLGLLSELHKHLEQH